MPCSLPGRRLGELSLIVVCLATFVSAMSAGAADDTDRPQDRQAIRAAAEAYREALQRGDGAALAALWTPDGDIVDEAGSVLKGRDTVQDLAPSKPGESAEQARVEIRETNLRFLSADVAIEDGTVDIVPPGGVAPLHGRFSATWVRHEDAWKLAALRECRGTEAGPETLADLEWMVGDWVVAEDPKSGATTPGKPVVELSVRWNPTRTFLLRDMRIAPAGAPADPSQAHVISQRIGWDPLTKTIRSWAFSSDGGHGEAVWSRDDGSWVARTSAVLPDGSQTSALNIYSYDGKDRCAWRSVPTHVGGEQMPGVSLTLVRKPGTGASKDSPR